jgi:hypothetical protein
MKMCLGAGSGYTYKYGNSDLVWGLVLQKIIIMVPVQKINPDSNLIFIDSNWNSKYFTCQSG